MGSSEEAVIMKSTVELQSRSYLLNLTGTEVYWEAVSSSWTTSTGPYSQPLVKTENQTIKLTDIIAVQAEKPKTRAHKEGQFQNLEMVSVQTTSFSIHLVHRHHRHKWRDRKVTFNCKDVSLCQQWVGTLHDVLARPEFKRPRKLLIFINPYGGKRRGPKIYREKVAPWFDLANITTEVIVTQRQNHARDMLFDYDLKSIDGVVCVGGDGMFSELLHGVMAQTHQQGGVDVITMETELQSPSIRFGVIPAGSTDALAFSIHGTNDPITAALHIIVGDSIGVDVGAVFHDNHFLKYQLSLLGYGYFGDVIADSENNRWMGPSRYNWSGFKKVVSNKSYEGEISYVASSDTGSHPKDGTVCKTGCRVCQQPKESPTEKRNGSEDQWQRIKGRFLAINCFTISCRCEKSLEGTAPSAHLGDGHMDVVIVHDTSTINYTRFLYRCTRKEALQYDLPFVQVFRAKRIKFRPTSEETDDGALNENQDGHVRLRSGMVQNSWWNCDGELLDQPSIEARVHRKVITMFGRGIEDDIKVTGQNCMQCACPQN